MATARITSSSTFGRRAKVLDQRDPLRSLRRRFHFPRRPDGTPFVYLAGNSLGLMPRKARHYVDEALTAWNRRGVEGHFSGPSPWLSYHRFVTDGLAALVGAKTHEIVAMNTLSVNLHLMLTAFYRPAGRRVRILTASPSFPSDRYAIRSHLQARGLDPDRVMTVIPPGNHRLLCEQDILDYLEKEGSTVALVLLENPSYLTGQALPMRRLTRAAHAAGAKIGFDLAHGFGNLSLSLHKDGADFAVWCHYKYGNTGPGAVGGVFVHDRHARDFSIPRHIGWWAHEESSRFRMPERVSLAMGAEGFQVSNPPIFSLAPLRASLSLFEEAGRDSLAAKRDQLTEFLLEALDERIGNLCEVITPRDPNQRGSQISLAVRADAGQIQNQLRRHGVICDSRKPDIVRVAPTPLYNSFGDIVRFVTTLRQVLAKIQ